MTINAKIECDRKSDIYGADYLEVKITAEIEEPAKAISAIYKIANPSVNEHSCIHPRLDGDFRFKLQGDKLVVTRLPATDSLCIATKQSLDFRGNIELAQLEAHANKFTNYGTIVTKTSQINALFFNNQADAVFVANNASFVSGASFSNSGDLSIDTLSGSFADFYIDEQASAYFKHSCKITNTSDLEVKGKLVVGDEFYYQGKRDLLISKDAVLVSKNRMNLKCQGRAKLYGIVGAKDWFSLKPQAGLEIGANSQVYTDGDTFIKSKNGNLDNLGLIHAGRFVGLSGRNINNSSCIVSKDNSTYTATGSISNQGDMLASNNFSINAGSSFNNKVGARAIARALEFNTPNINNQSNLHYTPLELPIIQSKITALDNAIAEASKAKHGLIGAQQSIQFNGRVSNSGTLFSNGTIDVASEHAIYNLQGAFILAYGKISLQTTACLTNAGSVVTKDTLDINTEGRLHNLAGARLEGGLVHAKAAQILTDATSKILSGPLELEAISSIRHSGDIKCSRVSILVTKENGLFKNFAGANISSNASLSISSNTLVNDGLLGAYHVSLHASLFRNYKAGAISSDTSIAIICADIIENYGKLKAMRHIKATAGQSIKNLSTGRIVAVDSLSLIAGIVENAGILSGRCARLEVTNEIGCFKNLSTARLIAEEDCNIISKHSQNSGQIISNTGNITLRGLLVFKNLNGGNILAGDALSILGKQGDNRGSIKAKSALINFSQSFDNYHSIKTIQTLSITTPSLKHNRGTIQSNTELILKLTNCSLKGNILADDKFILDLSNGYIFNHELNVIGSIELKSKRNAKFVFNKNLSSKQDISITTGTLEMHNKAQLIAGGKFSSDSLNFDLEDAGIYGATSVSITNQNEIILGRGIRKILSRTANINISNEAYIASLGDVNIETKAGITNKYATIDVGGNLMAKASGNLHNLSGTIRVVGNTSLLVNRTINEMLFSNRYSTDGYNGSGVAKSLAAVFNIGGDLNSYCAIHTIGSSINIGGNYNSYRGGLICKDVEEFTDWASIESINGAATYVKQHTTHKIHRGAINVQHNMTASTQANYVLPHVATGNNIQLNFNSMHVPAPIDERDSPGQPTQVVNINEYYRASGLFQYNRNTEYAISAGIGLNVTLPRPVFIGRANITNLRYKYCPALEERILQDALTSHGLSLSATSVLRQLRQNSLAELTRRRTSSLSKAQLLASKRPLVVYELEDYQGEQLIVPRLVVPKHASRNGMSAQNIHLSGKQLLVEGCMHARALVDIKAVELTVNSKTIICHESGIALKKLQANTGVIKGAKVNIQAGVLQHSGSISSNRDMHIETHQLNIYPIRQETALGSNIRPDFSPAKIISAANLNLSTDILVGSGLDIRAKQSLNIRSQVINLKLAVEYYTLPERKKKSLFRTKISGGIAPSVQGNHMQGKQIIIATNTGCMQNVIFTGKPIYPLRRPKIENLSPQAKLYSYSKMSFVGQLAVIASSSFGAAFLAPVLLGASAGTLATAVTRGIIQGAISAGLSRGNILKGALQSGALAGFGNQFSSAIEAQKYSKIFTDIAKASTQAFASHIITDSHFGHNLIAGVISGSAGLDTNTEQLSIMQKIINGVVSDVILSAVSKRSLSQTLQSGILNAVGTMAAQHGEAMGMRIAQKQMQVTAHKLKPAARHTAPTKTKASAKLTTPTKTNMFQIEPLTSTTTSTSLTDSISNAIDRDLGYLVNPRQIATNAIATSTTMHRRALRDNPSDSFSINATYGSMGNQDAIYQINYQTPRGRVVQEMGRMYWAGIAAGCDNRDVFIMGQYNVPRQTSFVGRVVNGLVNLIPAAHASAGDIDPMSSSSAQIANDSISNSTQTGYVRKAAGRIGQQINQYLSQHETVATAVKVAGATSDALLKLTIYTGARLTGHSEQQACQQVARFDQELSEAVHIVANRYNLTQDEMVGFTAMVGISAPALGPALRLTGKNSKYLVQRTPAALNFSANLAKRTTNAVQEFVVTHDFRSPIFIQPPKGTMLYSFPGGVVDGIKFRNPVKLKSEVKINSSIKAKIKEAQLPIEGRIRFIPQKGYKSSMELPSIKDPFGKIMFKDRFGNHWKKGPSRTPGESFEWDVQLSNLGKVKLGWLSRDGSHVNVSLRGKITHK